MNKADIEELFDKYLRRYQRLSLFIIYPSLVSFFGLCLAIFSKGFSYSMCLSSNYILAYYLSNNQIGDSEVIGNIIVLGLGVVLLAANVFLGLKASKAKRYFMIAGISLYFADFIYALTLGFDGVYGQLSVINYVIMLVMHAVFLGIYAYMVVVYVKLLHINAKRRAK